MNSTTKQNPVGRTSAAVSGGDSESESWYFVRLAFLAIPWTSRRNKGPKGTLFKQYFLVRARNIESAFNKASHILSVSEHLDEGGGLNGKKVIFKKVGILDLEPLYERLKSGVELFDESEMDVAYTDIKKQAISPQQRTRMIAYENKNGKPSLLHVYRGKHFDRL